MGEIFEEGSEGNFVADGAWIPEEHKAEESLKNITNFGDLVKGYVNAQHTIGKKGVIIPEEGASDEEMNAFHTAMGRPEKATDYEFAKPNLPDGMEFDEKLDAGFREFAHKNGLSQKKAAAISDWYNGNMIEAYGANTKAIKANQEESVALLKKTWGKDADANFALAEKAFKTFVPDETKQAMFGKLGDSPALIEAFLSIGKAMSEDKLVAGNENINVDAKKEIEKIKLDPNHAFNKANDPGHDAAVEAMTALYKQAYPKLAQSA